MNGKVLLLGGSGFLGSYVARRLSARGMRIVVPSRRYEHVKHLTVLPTVKIVEADIHDDVALAGLVAGQDALINLVGILRGGNGWPYGSGFARAHVDLPCRAAMAAASAEIHRVVHVSALHALADAPSGYLRSKAAGEAAVRAAFPEATILRPSVIFGAGDSFLSMFAGLLKLAPLVPLASPDARFQPVWAGNVADAIVESLLRSESAGRNYDLCGPRIYTLKDLIEYVGAITGHRRPVIGLSPALSYLQAWMMEVVGGPMTRDNLRSMSIAIVCSADCALPFGLDAVPLEDIAPAYLGRPSR